MKKKAIITLVALSLVCAGVVYAAGKKSTGKVVSVSGTNITIKLDAPINAKAGDKVKVEAVGGGSSKSAPAYEGC